MPEINLKLRGPLLTHARGWPARRVNAMMEEMKEAVAREGVNMVRRQLDRVLQNPTGYYSSRVATDTAGENIRIHDSNVIYGPWLEGTSSRNQTTRFKGYSTFRIVKQRLNRAKSNIIRPIADRYIREFNG